MICNSFSLTFEKKLCANTKSDSWQPRVKELSMFTLTQSEPHCFGRGMFLSSASFLSLSFSSGRTGKVFFHPFLFCFSFPPSPVAALARSLALVIHHEVGSDSQSDQMECPQHPYLMSLIMVWYLDWGTLWLLGLGRFSTIDIQCMRIDSRFQILRFDPAVVTIWLGLKFNWELENWKLVLRDGGGGTNVGRKDTTPLRPMSCSRRKVLYRPRSSMFPSSWYLWNFKFPQL